MGDQHLTGFIILLSILLTLAVIVIVVMLYKRSVGCVLCDCICPITKSNKDIDAEAQEAVNRGVCICFRCGCGKNAGAQEKEEDVEDEKKEAVTENNDTSCDEIPLVDSQYIYEMIEPKKAKGAEGEDAAA
jgi:hypothetical protein